MQRFRRRHHTIRSRSSLHHRRLRGRRHHSSNNRDSSNSNVRPSRIRSRMGTGRVRDPMLQQAKEIILQLRTRLEERHLLATKIIELDKALQRISECSNEVLVEMENRIDDLDRDWQRRIRSENSKWQQRVEELQKHINNMETTHALSVDPVWRIEKRLLSIENYVKPIEQINKKVTVIGEVINGADMHTPRKARSNDDLHTAEMKASGCRACAIRDRRPCLYGVVEMTETYSMCVRNVERAIKSLSEIAKMPAVIGNTPDGVSSVAEVDRTARMLTDFVRKLRISLRESHFIGSPEEPDWDE